MLLLVNKQFSDKQVSRTVSVNPDLKRAFCMNKNTKPVHTLILSHLSCFAGRVDVTEQGANDYVCVYIQLKPAEAAATRAELNLIYRERFGNKKKGF